jgi:hypothetical protein
MRQRAGSLLCFGFEDAANNAQQHAGETFVNATATLWAREQVVDHGIDVLGQHLKIQIS